MMVIFIFFDDACDSTDPETAQSIADMAKDAMWNPHKPHLEGEHFLGEVFRE
jgi:hypothetical protein